MQRSSVAARYSSLGDHLTRQAASGHHQVVLSFAQLEAIFGRPLPPTARRSRYWWENRGREPHAWYGWLRAGWLVGAVSLATEAVTFTRGDGDERG